MFFGRFKVAKTTSAQQNALTAHAELILSASEIGFSGFERLSTLSMALVNPFLMIAWQTRVHSLT